MSIVRQRSKVSGLKEVICGQLANCSAGIYMVSGMVSLLDTFIGRRESRPLVWPWVIFHVLQSRVSTRLFDWNSARIRFWCRTFIHHRRRRDLFPYLSMLRFHHCQNICIVGLLRWTLVYYVPSSTVLLRCQFMIDFGFHLKNYLLRIRFKQLGQISNWTNILKLC